MLSLLMTSTYEIHLLFICYVSSHREKEKAEVKDRKVLEILNVKDDKIDELQKLVATQSKELSELIIK